MFKYLFGNNTQLGEKEKKKKNTIGNKTKDEKFIMIRKELISELPKYENVEDIQKEEKLKRGKTFIDGRTEKERQNYIARHKVRENWNKSGIHTAGFWSRWILWNKPTLQESINDVEKRFNIKIINKT